MVHGPRTKASLGQFRASVKLKADVALDHVLHRFILLEAIRSHFGPTGNHVTSLRTTVHGHCEEAEVGTLETIDFIDDA